MTEEELEIQMKEFHSLVFWSKKMFLPENSMPINLGKMFDEHYPGVEHFIHKEFGNFCYKGGPDIQKVRDLAEKLGIEPSPYPDPKNAIFQFDENTRGNKDDTH